MPSVDTHPCVSHCSRKCTFRCSCFDHRHGRTFWPRAETFRQSVNQRRPGNPLLGGADLHPPLPHEAGVECERPRDRGITACPGPYSKRSEVKEADREAVTLLKEEAASATHTPEASGHQAAKALATSGAHVLCQEGQLAAARASRAANAVVSTACQKTRNDTERAERR